MYTCLFKMCEDNSLLCTAASLLLASTQALGCTFPNLEILPTSRLKTICKVYPPLELLQTHPQQSLHRIFISNLPSFVLTQNQKQ
jgi:hypothetical protein